MNIPKYYQLNIQSKPATAAVVQVGPVRFTVLSARMIRMEYHPEGHFEDRPSQVFWHREQPVVSFETKQQEGEVILQTETLRLHYREGLPFTTDSLWIEILGTPKRWRFGMEHKENLLGTTRTLDMADGAVSLEQGLLSKRGWTLVDDSQALVFNEQGWLEERQPGGVDLYFWYYGKDYQLGMAEYYRISGKPGLLPRWALGNWWSRFWEYTADELVDLMRTFRQKEVPLGVCIIDMDWHLTKTGNGSTGWTGYTWNKELFPDPAGFIGILHAMGLKTGLNLHPAEGIWPHEEKYPEMAQAMGIDPASKQPVAYDVENPVFVEAYFKHLHHPYEADGIDFWWMDWQQGNPNRMAGLNLLWWINHLHYMDSGRNPNKRSFLFSRWGGLGNHRYPIGFSGDTFVTWDSLAFQPYMTATAANVGYSWWSHDIGGHMGGMDDGELYTRWVQFGVFSPILRLHSTKNIALERRPWGFDANVERAAGNAMRFRHQLIPYIYSMAWKDHREGLPLVRPLYYLAPESEDAYACPNVYTFGTELIAAPFTSPASSNTRLARQAVWLPGAGNKWYGLFDHQVYGGDDWHALYGGLQDMPVFAKAGAIVPLAPEVGWGGVENPRELEVHIFPGAENFFDLYDDDGESQAYLQGAYSITKISIDWKANDAPGRFEQKIIIHPARGDTSLLPTSRNWTLVCHALLPGAQVEVRVNGKITAVTTAYDAVAHTLRLGSLELLPSDELQVLVFCSPVDQVDKAGEVHRLASAFRLETETRQALLLRAQELADDPWLLAEFASGLTGEQLRALMETLTGAGIDIHRAGGQQAPARLVVWNNQRRPEIDFLYSVERAVIHQPALRNAAATELEDRRRIFWPDKELGRGKAVWAMNYASVLRVEEHFPD